MILGHLFTRIFGTPLAISQPKLDAILGGIGDRFGIEVTEAQLEAASKSIKAQSPAKDYQIAGDIAVIGVQGTLMKKTYGLMATSGCSSYEGIAAQVQSALDNPAVKGILLDIDSPGGETSGLFELCDALTAASDKKPLYASADNAYSAAYAIASCADQIFVTQTGGVGSIGVICTHVDQSQADAKAGLKYTFIHAGDKKADGNPHAPLSETAQNDTQAEVDRQYQMFLSLVATNRGISLASVTNTQAGTFHGDAALRLLADKIGTFDDALAALSNSVNNTKFINTTVSTPGASAAVTEDLTTMAKDNLNIEALLAANEAAKKTAEDDEEMKDCAEATADTGDSEDEQDDDTKKKNDDEDDTEEASKKKGKAEATRIVTLCALAGVPEMAATFLVENYSATDVEKALLKHRSKKSASVKTASAQATSPTLANTAAQIRADKKISASAKADAYKAFLMANATAYVQHMTSRKEGDANYTFLKARGY